jgi:hypothetical protein
MLHILLLAARRLERLKPFNPEKARRRRGKARLFAFGLTVALGTGTCATYSSAQSRLDEGSFGVGRELYAMKDLLKDAHRINLNGQAIWMSSTATHDDLTTILDRFEAHCRQNQGASADLWRQLAASKTEAATALPEGSNPLTFMRRSNGNEGVVMCLTKTQHQNKDGVLAGLDFARTSDLGHLGAVRYAYAHRTKTGTTVMTAWTEEHFKLDALYPKGAEDVAGTDSDLAPRPPGNTLRLLSARLDGTPYGVRVYQSSAATPHEVFLHYDTEMRKRGYGRLVDSKDLDGGRGYMKGGIMVVVSAQPDPNGGTAVTVGDLGGVDFSNAPKLTEK